MGPILPKLDLLGAVFRSFSFMALLTKVAAINMSTVPPIMEMHIWATSESKTVAAPKYNNATTPNSRIEWPKEIAGPAQGPILRDSLIS